MAEAPEKIGQLIRERREARGWSQQELATKAGTSQQNVGRIEAGSISHSRYVQPILEALGSDLGKALIQTTEPGDVIPQQLLVADKGMPLVASAEGGDGAIIIDFEPVDYLKWPAPLLHVKEGF